MTKIEKRLKIYFPRTLRGWNRFFWLSCQRCPIHKRRLYHNYPYDGDHVVYGFCCEGWSIWPNGIIHILHQNFLSEQMTTATKGSDDELAKLQARIVELETILEAWHSQFGTTQLSHAKARLEAAESEVKRLRATKGSE